MTRAASGDAAEPADPGLRAAWEAHVSLRYCLGQGRWYDQGPEWRECDKETVRKALDLVYMVAAARSRMDFARAARSRMDFARRVFNVTKGECELAEGFSEVGFSSWDVTFEKIWAQVGLYE